MPTWLILLLGVLAVLGGILYLLGIRVDVGVH